MNDINTCTVLGRLTREPDIRLASAATAIASFSIAANHRYQDKAGQWKDEVAFVPCSAFGHLAERLVGKQKGELILATGRLRTESWQKEGVSHSRLVLIVGTIHFVQPRMPPKETAGASQSSEGQEAVRKAVPF